MKPYIMTIPLIPLLLFSGLTICAKPRIVDIDKELKTAKTVAFATVESYTDTTLTFRLPGLLVVDKVQTAGLRPFDKFFKEDGVTGSLPQKGKYVLIVIDTNNYVSLFANVLRDNSQLIFWSPVNTGGECFFTYGNNFSADTLARKKDARIRWWEESKFPEKMQQCKEKVVMSLDVFYFRYTHDNYETGRILIQGNDILFIPDLSDSRAYVIQNKDEFKSLNRRRISAFGKLINYNEFEIREFKVID